MLLLLTSCKTNIHTQALTDFKDYSKAFGEAEGTMVIFQSKLNHYLMYNGALATEAASPDETYRVYLALMGLQYDLVDPSNPLKTLDMKRVATAISMEDTAALLDEMDYGNKDLTGPPESYWLNSTLKLTPIQQIEMMRRLYIQVLPFKVEDQVLVKEQLLIKTIGDAKLYGITSTASDQNNWFVGFIEKEKTPHFFALRVIGGTDGKAETLQRIAIDIFKTEGLIAN